jgi:glucosamine--fructose-6-phosphate aminotransferase (isomerizing)
MCGIVGAVVAPNSGINVVPILIEGLKKLEYRGYDSAGLAIAVAQDIRRIRAVGRVAELEQKSSDHIATTGIAHTRWATHGGVTASNAHPHLSERDGLAICVVHNGIIENHDVLRESLSGQGYVFQSETDTEVIAHLIHRYRQGCKSLRQAVHEARQQLKGAYAIAVMSSQDPQELVGTRQGAPLFSKECF